MKEIGRQTARILNLNDICDEKYESRMGIPIPMLPSVKNYFGLNFTEPVEKKEDYFGEGIKDRNREVEDYIQAYLWWYHDMVI